MPFSSTPTLDISGGHAHDEYFHGDNGAGLGASHQTGWTGLVAPLISLFGVADPARFLAEGVSAAFPSARPRPK